MRVILSILMILVLVTCQSTKYTPTQDNLSIYNKVAVFHAKQVADSVEIQFYADDIVNQIVLIRHGEPKLDKKSARSRKKMKQYIYDYDTAHVKPFENSPVQFDGQIDTVYASPIVRASDTAHKLFKAQFVIIEDSVFREFEREVFPLPLLKLRPKTWGVLSRIPWAMGLQSRKVEGFRQAKKRAKKDAQFLIDKAKENNRAVLVAHGFLNRYVSKYLQEEGWQLSYDGGKDYLSVQVLSRVEE